MPVKPGVLGTPGLTKTGRRSRLLFHWRARDLSLTPLTGQVPTFSRASAGGGVLDRYGRYVLPVHSQERYELVDLDGDGVAETAGLVLEPARTNSLLWSSDVSNAAWGSQGTLSLSAAVSVLPGQVAQLFTNGNVSGSTAKYQTAGVLSAAGDTAYMIVENVDADTTDIGLYDSTLSSFVARATFTWATRSIAVTGGSGSLFAVKLAESGPNGGPVYLLGVSGLGTAGNGRRVYLYPTGVSQNAKRAVVHHAQLEGGVLFPTSPIVTGAASASRSRDSYEVPINWGMQDLTVYLRYVSRGHEGHDASSKILMAIGQVGAATRFQIQQAGGASSLTANVAGVAAGASPGLSVASVSPGTLVELSAQLDYTQLSGAAALSLALALNGGSPTTTAAGAAAAVSTGFQGNALALGAIPGTTSVDWAGTFLSAKVAAGLLTLDQMREAL